MQHEIIRSLKLTKEDKEYILNVGTAVELELTGGIFDVVQIVKINDKSLTVGSYMTPNNHPYYIKFKDIVNIIDIMNEKDQEIIDGGESDEE